MRASLYKPRIDFLLYNLPQIDAASVKICDSNSSLMYHVPVKRRLKVFPRKARRARCSMEKAEKVGRALWT